MAVNNFLTLQDENSTDLLLILNHNIGDNKHNLFISKFYPLLQNKSVLVKLKYVKNMFQLILRLTLFIVS